jgi:glycosyltransferase involved in cell wall biosynthesis
VTRIAIVLPDLGAGGAQRVMLSFAKGLADAGRSVAVFVVAREGPAPRVVIPAGIVPHEIGARRLRSGIFPLLRELDSWDPGIVVSVMGYLNLLLLAMRGRLKGCPQIVVREANELEATRAALPPWIPARAAYRFLYGRADLVIAPTAAIAASITAWTGLEADRLAVVPNPVDVATLRRAGSPAMRRPGSGLRIVAAGRLVEQKGFDRLIDAASGLDLDAHVAIFGAGPQRAALAARIAAAGLVARVSLEGHVRDLPAWIAGADVFALPSRWEGLPNVALEALALGTPVVATPDARAALELADEAENAVTLADPGPDFAAALADRTPRALAAAPYASLLPPRFAASAAIDAFAAALDGIGKR